MSTFSVLLFAKAGLSVKPSAPDLGLESLFVGDIEGFDPRGSGNPLNPICGDDGTWSRTCCTSPMAKVKM